MKKKELIKKIFTGFFIMIALLGALLIITRGDPADSAIGDVVVTNGYDRIALDCHKYSYNDKNGSRKIDTFDVSIQPYEDCCTVFTPKHPKTKPVLEEVIKEQNKLDCENLVERAVEGVKLTVIE